ncbi:MAG TPA: hypothetical protein VNL95_03575 [Dehalococcoidia bacterium]|nr:hypothetical protein [Dehalococcoidia bacterium]
MAAGRPRLRIGPLQVSQGYELPPRPPGPAAAQDAYRQSFFLLGEELETFRQGMALQVEMAAALAKVRTPEAAIVLGLWSRSFSCLADACRLMLWGSYASCPPLVKTACDMVAAQRGLLASGFQEWHAWLESWPAQDRERAALGLEMGRYRSSAAIAADGRLSAVYRAAAELSQPHFGGTLLQVGPEVALDHLPLAFADCSFHLGWAEVVLGWLLRLCHLQAETVASADLAPLPEGTAEALARLETGVEAALARPDRCRLTEEPDGRFLVVNFRRKAGGHPRRLVL